MEIKIAWIADSFVGLVAQGGLLRPHEWERTIRKWGKDDDTPPIRVQKGNTSQQDGHPVLVSARSRGTPESPTSGCTRDILVCNYPKIQQNRGMKLPHCLWSVCLCVCLHAWPAPGAVHGFPRQSPGSNQSLRRWIKCLIPRYVVLSWSEPLQVLPPEKKCYPQSWGYSVTVLLFQWVRTGQTPAKHIVLLLSPQVSWPVVATTRSVQSPLVRDFFVLQANIWRMGKCMKRKDASLTTPRYVGAGSRISMAFIAAGPTCAIWISPSS